MKYTIKALADLAGVTTRTLRYYDEIGLLEPASFGENGYRYYDYGNLLVLAANYVFSGIGGAHQRNSGGFEPP